MQKKTGLMLLVAGGLAMLASSAHALGLVVTHIDRNADGTATYHFALKTAPGESFTAGADFITVYNFKLVDGSAKSPSGWSFSSEEYGKTPTWSGYPVVGPIDMPGLSNLTWTASKTIAGGTQVDGFSATTRLGTGKTTEGEFTAQITRSDGGKPSKQALIGQLPVPSYLQ